jgi:hypothetical protein
MTNATPFRTLARFASAEQACALRAPTVRTGMAHNLAFILDEMRLRPALLGSEGQFRRLARARIEGGRRTHRLTAGSCKCSGACSSPGRSTGLHAHHSSAAVYGA